MALAIKKDIKHGTYVEEGILDRRLSRGVRKCLVYDDTPADITLDAGHDHAVAQLETFFPGTTHLPLQTVRSVAYGGKVVSLGIYQFRVFGGTESDDPFATATIESVIDKMEWWSDNTMQDHIDPAEYGPYPAGPVNVVCHPQYGGAAFPRPWIRTIPLLRISVDVTLASPVQGDPLWELMNTINSNNFNIANKTFPPRTLYFPGVKQDSVLFTTPANNVHQVRYTFLARRDGWVRERTCFQPPDFQQIDGVEDMFEDKTWDPGQFPTS